MDFEAVARCYRELKCYEAHAGGAAHELLCLVMASQSLTADDKSDLERAIQRVIPAFGTFDETALFQLHDMLMKYEEFTRAWLVECLAGNGQTEAGSD